MARALEEPIRQLADNAGLEGSIVVDKIRTGTKGHGLNVETGDYEDLVKAGIIDPTMVTRSALQNAASIAKNILTTEAVVAEAAGEAAGRGRNAGRHARHDVKSTGETMFPPCAPFFGRCTAKGPAEPALLRLMTLWRLSTRSGDRSAPAGLRARCRARR